MENIQFKRMLVFAIMMGDDEVLSKAPEYIKEKFRRAMESECPESMLHVIKKNVMGEYLFRWKDHLTEEDME